ncbi:MAG: cobalt ECF transporter T component CbiQ [Muribaculaceae bacterium]|nr:cobalt ECF transporter T component CbiQ [Muribaculaceae bacterium]
MKIQKALLTLSSYQTGSEEKTILSGLDSRALILVTLAYIICILSLPIEVPDVLIWFAIYPIMMAPLSGRSYTSVFIKSLYVLPFILVIGIANPFYDRRPAFEIGNMTVTYGWLSFLTIVLRGLLSVQALIILIGNCGFIGFCNALIKLRVPKVLTTQLLLLYRYVGLLLQEAFNMHRALTSRGYGKKSFPMKMWATMVGSLLIHTYERSKRIHYAMLSRGFNGSIPLGTLNKWRLGDSIFCVTCLALFLFLSYFNLGQLLFPANPSL